MDKYFISIAGNIGVGKSTLVRLLSQRHGWEPVYEAVEENPYLADFYQDMQRWSFPSQVFFLSRRLRQHNGLLKYKKSVIQDRTVYEDAEIFARNLYDQGHMAERDWSCYFDLYRTLAILLPAPDLVIYLKASMPTLRRRIAMRGREYEQEIDEKYLERLNLLYARWVENFNLCPVLTVDTDNLNFLQHDEHLDQIWQKIVERLQGKDYLKLT
ncbi:MAG: deoxynucleoside kinase [Chloroflexi bacterium]|nr:MAG: deoxynucleoside kinase [Chloroflexota bacterium]PIE81171.1 MAG: deoxynucleoside kinase [Chloroflexota bacterium]